MLEGMEGVVTFAQNVDHAFIVTLTICIVLFLSVVLPMFYFAFKYKASKSAPEDTQNISHYTPIEIAWTVIPTILVFVVFYYGYESLKVQRTMPKDNDAIIVDVVAKKWSWSFQYENGKKSTKLMVPVNQNIKLRMTAPKNDVLHNFYVPAFRTKEDIIPGEITYLWFNATKKGKYDVQCAEYCGTRHAYMLTHVHVVDEQEYQDFITSKKSSKNKNGIDALAVLENNGCIGCHTMDGTPSAGPTFKDIMGRKTNIIENGKTREITIDETYLKEAINNPASQIVEGYSNIMPPYMGVLSDKEVSAIIEYLKQEPDAMEILQNNGCIGCHTMDGTPSAGPTFKGIMGRKTKIIENGKTREITIDETYLKEAINNPASQIVEGYSDIMPPYMGVLKEKEVDAIIKYLNQ